MISYSAYAAVRNSWRSAEDEVRIENKQKIQSIGHKEVTYKAASIREGFLLWIGDQIEYNLYPILATSFLCGKDSGV